MKANKLDRKPVSVFLLVFGILGLLLMAHHIFSYEAILRPRMDYLLENKIITNGVSGAAFLRMFTNESNKRMKSQEILLHIPILQTS